MTHPRVDTLTIVAFVLSFIVGIAGVVLGHTARSQLLDNGEAGWGFATFALFLGYLSTVLAVLAVLSVVVTVFATMSAA
ncbi:DUF4190 domain-containing protein [Rathayibacter oskolensis]|uniref:DUF4190 domain-containing protein n=1 Tax=Rathayibacter oskolensis TaxID=1891671 RepID=UPI00265EEAE4|nr:DUF4190 domain-containing protein [Rathayibacter oskolensis]WKK71013.1 DUF4190 domain-containing protein [Rathayibacter oskolensis]